MSDRSLTERARRRLWGAVKPWAQRAVGDGSPPRTVWVLGCQRSGTTMMLRIFQRDFRTQVYHEPSDIFTDMRLRTPAEVNQVLGASPATIRVGKPLLDSQRARSLLETYPGSVGIWMFRHYRAVAASHVRTFDNKSPLRDIEPIISGDSRTWRGESISEETRATVAEYFSESMNPVDAAALHWLARNRLFFEQDLGSNACVVLCSYEELVRAPRRELQRLYSHIGVECPRADLSRGIHQGSLDRGREVCLRDEIEAECQSMWNRLMSRYQS